MMRIGASAVIAALASCLFASTPSAAFGFHLGPFFLGLPFPRAHFGYRHHYHEHFAHSYYEHGDHEHGARAPLRQSASLHDEANLNAVEPAGAEAGPHSALLYPGAALPALYEEIFWPGAAAAWPFSYDAIFQAAFAKAASGTVSGCQQPARATAVVDRIRNETKPNADQARLLERLDGAFDMAAGYLAKACPNDVPARPVARLQLMEWQIEKLAQALDIIRPPLQDFMQSLDDGQRSRFASVVTPTGAVHADRPIAAACAATPTAVDRSIEQISLSVQPTDMQRDALNNLEHAFRSAASEIDANCPSSWPADPRARLSAAEARLDATWRAVVAIQVALAEFDNGLSDQQRARFDSTDFASVQ